MAVAFLQKVERSGGTSGSPFTQAYLSDNSAGSLLLVIARMVNNDGVHAGTVNITDSKGNSWSNLQVNTVSTTSTFQVSYAPNAIAGPNTLTFTIAAGTTWTVIDLVMFEYSGVKTSAPVVDQNSAVNTATGTAASGLAITNTATDLVILACCNDTLGPDNPISASSGFVVRQDATTNCCLIDQLNAPAATYTPVITLNASATWRTFTTSFFAATSGGGGGGGFLGNFIGDDNRWCSRMFSIGVDVGFSNGFLLQNGLGGLLLENNLGVIALE